MPQQLFTATPRALPYPESTSPLTGSALRDAARVVKARIERYDRLRADQMQAAKDGNHVAKEIWSVEVSRAAREAIGAARHLAELIEP